MSSEILLYKTANNEVKLEVLIQDENIWLNQKQLADLFGIQVPAISKHLKNIFEDRELEENQVVSKMETTANDGKRYLTNFYNLDAIISVGYRVNSIQATQFRIWATTALKEFIIKGFVMDDERLKNPKQPFGKDYFDEQLERIRDIRSSERRFYQKITDIYAKCSADYDPKSKETLDFYATVQNKLHFAIVGQTAAEIIKSRADRNKPNMGLSTWQNSPNGKIRKLDVTIAKNYLTVEELVVYNRIVTMYLDFAELQAINNKIMYQKDWIDKLGAFLLFNEYEILQDNGKVEKKVADKLATLELEHFKVMQDKIYVSDFDKELKKMLKEKKL